jgi:hypothetical protein
VAELQFLAGRGKVQKNFFSKLEAMPSQPMGNNEQF